MHPSAHLMYFSYDTHILTIDHVIVYEVFFYFICMIMYST
jgi:hypothetical protein